MTIRGIITILVLAILFGLAVVWISKQGGWKGEGCGGTVPPATTTTAASSRNPTRIPDASKSPRQPLAVRGLLCYSCPLWAA